MSKKNNNQKTNNEKSNKSISSLLKKKPVIAGIAAVVIVVIICIIIAVNFVSGKDNKSESTPPPATPTAEATKRPVVLPTTEAAATATAVEDTEAPQTPEVTEQVSPTPKPSKTDAPTENSPADEDIISDSSDKEAGMNAILKKEETLENQEKFDSYIDDKNYDEAKNLLDNFFKDNSYANNALFTYKNYVSFYEAQELYNDSAMFQLDYIEQKDGLDNVREESLHYQMLTETLQKIPDFKDGRLSAINASVEKWREMTNALNSGNYDLVIVKTKDYIKNGQETVTAYIYLSQAYSFKKENLEEAKVYYCYLGKDNTNMNQLEKSYYSVFYNMLNQLYYTDQITSEELEYIETEFDYQNYLK